MDDIQEYTKFLVESSDELKDLSNKKLLGTHLARVRSIAQEVQRESVFVILQIADRVWLKKHGTKRNLRL